MGSGFKVHLGAWKYTLYVIVNFDKFQKLMIKGYPKELYVFPKHFKLFLSLGKPVFFNIQIPTKDETVKTTLLKFTIPRLD